MENVTYDQVLALFAETSLQIKTLTAKTDEQIAQTDKQIAETGKQLKALAKQVGDVTDTLGRFTEEQVRPKILELFRARGVELEETHPRVRVEKTVNFF